MRKCRFLWGVLGGALASLVAPGGAAADEPGSRAPSRYLPLELEGDPERLLDERWKRIQRFEAVLELRARKLQELQELWQRFGNDLGKGDLNELKKTIESLRTAKPEVFKELDAAGILKMLQDPGRKPSPDDAQRMQEALARAMKRVQGDVGKPTPPDDDAPAPRPSGESPRADKPSAPDLEERLVGWLRDRLRDVDRSKLGDFLRDSPAWQDALAELDDLLNSRTPPSSRLEEWASGLLSDPMGWLEGLDPSELPLPSLPALDWRPGGVSVPAGLGAGWLWAVVEGILWSAIGVGFALALWFLWARTRTAAAESRPVWTPGPWPVDPALLADAGQLIRAFEHLAYLRLGLAARSCNHHALARKLVAPAEPAPKQQAARQLAQLYEQARYAPDAALSPEALDAARRSLCLLAGVALP